MLGTLSEDQKSDWKSYIAPIVHAYNATKNESTGYSPHYLMFGWHLRLAIDPYLNVDVPNEGSKSRESYAKKLRNRLSYAYKGAKSVAEKKGRKYKENYDMKVKNSKLEIGDKVLVRNLSVRGKNKLGDRSV